MRSRRRMLLAACVFTMFAGSARAQESAPAPAATADTSGGWETIVEPYFLMPNMSGSTGVGPFVGDVDASTGDIFGALDFGAMLYLERHDPRWAYSLDTMYMNLGAETTTPVGTLELDMKQVGVTFAGYRRIAPWAEALIAFQGNWIEAGVVGSGPIGVDASGDKSWLDPYIGARLMTHGSGKLRAGVVGMVGGFGVGSEFAWQVFPQAGYRVSDLFEITGGFRMIDMDYEAGSGNSTFVYDMSIYGAQVGGRFHF